MRQTLRRSCGECAKAKQKCDLQTPRCSRCTKRNSQCTYANEPLTGPSSPKTTATAASDHGSLTTYRFAALDPFDSYPQTRLPRRRVQRLIHSFLNKIAFQYYPLDLNAASNPFLISWWPLALGDPVLFHVSLQTACLDDELLAQKGFKTSEILMADSVALLRRKVENPMLAIQDGTLNSVITLATIEYGKGNFDVSRMHIEGVKKLVDMRGGISSVRQTSPLTGRMVSWVTMLVNGCPQFNTQDDAGIGDGIPPIPEWLLEWTDFEADLYEIDKMEIDDAVKNVFTRLRKVFQRARRIPFPTTNCLHDLTCFVVHRLLLTAPGTDAAKVSPITECIRYGIILYMLISQGPTYYSHAVFMESITERFMGYLEQFESTARQFDSLDVWFVSVGMVASVGTSSYSLFQDGARFLATSLQLRIWDDIFAHIKRVLWLELEGGQEHFKSYWDTVLGMGDPPSPLSECSSPIEANSIAAGLLLNLMAPGRPVSVSSNYQRRQSVLVGPET